MSVRHPIAEMRAAIAGRRFGVIRVAFAMPATRPLYAQSPTFRCFGAIDALGQRQSCKFWRTDGLPVAVGWHLVIKKLVESLFAIWSLQAKKASSGTHSVGFLTRQFA
jgi:hypothetical protein